jgi:O-acetylhomoserine/O-acetylserine sulfhydrylase-like pyridoxal-dependent enzyme
LLAGYGVETSYFDPAVGAGIAALFKPNTKAVLVEAPGSQSFEMPDIRAISGVAHARGALVIDQIYRRTFRHNVRHHLGERHRLAQDCRNHPAARRLRRAR